jgi:hypothetical protein
MYSVHNVNGVHVQGNITGGFICGGVRVGVPYINAPRAGPTVILCSGDDGQGATVEFQGASWANVVRITIETSDKRKQVLPGELTAVELRVVGACERVETESGGVTIEGECGQVTTQTGNVTIGGNCAGSVSTQAGAVDVRGAVMGSVKTFTGNICHREK